MAVKRRGRIFFVFLAFLVSLALIELAADAVRYVRTRQAPVNKRSTLTFKRDDYRRYHFTPNQVGTMQDRPVRINSIGLRGGEPVDRKYRVVCLGESCTFGWHASADDKTYPALLEAKLTDLDVDVVNAGMPRCNAMDLLDLYVAELQHLKPDVLVLMVGWNDISYQFTQPTGGRAEPAPRNLDTFSIVYLTRLMMHGLRKPSDEEVIAAAETGDDDFRWQFLEVYQRILRTFAAMTRANGTQLVLITLPHYLGQDLGEADKKRLLPHLLSWPHISYAGWWEAVKRTNAVIRRVAAELEVPLVEGEQAVPAELFTDICHLDDAGNEQLARPIADRVRKVLQDLPR